MAIKELSGKIQTVLGPIDPAEMGITLPHEHLISDGSSWFIDPEDELGKKMAHAPVSLESLWWVRYHWHRNKDNLTQLDEKETTWEVMRFKDAGGGAVVDISPHGFGRDPDGLMRIAKATGLHIIMGSGYYLAPSMPPDFDLKSEQDITDEIVRDITEGVNGSSARAGLIGEIGCSWPLDPKERKSLKAAVAAQKITGANLNVHPGQAEESAFQIVELLEEWGADLTRTTMDHVDRAVREPENRLKLAQKGLTLEYDLFGRDGHYPIDLRVIDMPTDHHRISEIQELIEAGYIEQILISHDIWNKHQRVTYGGWGYDHLLRNVVPIMKAKGMTDEQIHTIMVDNPRRVFTFL